MKLFLSIIITATALFSQAQSLNPRVVASGGGFGFNGQGSISYTLGELATSTESTPAGTLGQGFQQAAGANSVSVKELSSENAGIFIYPNPGNGFSNIRYVLSGSSGSIEIYDLNGKRLSLHKMNEKEGVLNTRNLQLAAGVYFVIFQSNGYIQKNKMIILQ